MYGVLCAKFQPDVFNLFVLICRCLLHMIYDIIVSENLRFRPSPGGGGGWVLPYNRLMGMCRWGWVRIFTTRLTIDPTFCGIFVCGPLQSLVVNVCTIMVSHFQ